MLGLTSSKSFFISLFLLVLAHESADTFTISAQNCPCDPLVDSSWQLNKNAHFMHDQLFLDGSHSQAAVALFTESSFSLSEDVSLYWNFTFTSNTTDRGSFIIVSTELNTTQTLISIDLSAACHIDCSPTLPADDCKEHENRPLVAICGLLSHSNCSPFSSNPAAVISLHDFKGADAEFTHAIPLDILNQLLAPDQNRQTLYAGFIADKGATININEWCFTKTNESQQLGYSGSGNPCPNINEWCITKTNESQQLGYSGSGNPCPNVNSVKSRNKRFTVVFWVVATLIAFSMLMGLAAIFIICTKKRRRPHLLQAARPSARPPTINFQPQAPQRPRARQESSATPIMSAPSALHVDPKAFEVTGTVSWLNKPNPR